MDGVDRYWFPLGSLAPELLPLASQTPKWYRDRGRPPGCCQKGPKERLPARQLRGFDLEDGMTGISSYVRHLIKIRLKTP